MPGDFEIIYKITHNVTGKMYIGRTKNLTNRIKCHMRELRKGKHPVEDMQYDYDTYGENYTIEIIGMEKYRTRLEFEMMKKHRSYFRGVGYNYKDNCLEKKHDLLCESPHIKGGVNMYPNLRAEIARKGLKLETIAYELRKRGFNVTVSMLSEKFNGKREIKLNEAKAIKIILETDLPLDILFEEEAC